MTSLGLQPFLIYPAVIKLRHKGEQKSFDSSQKAEDFISFLSFYRAVVGLMDRALDLKPEVTQGCGFESRLRQEVHDCSPGAAQSAAHCSKCVCVCVSTAPCVCALGWVKCREHISLLIILCIIVYVTNKAHPSLICIVLAPCLNRRCMPRLYGKATGKQRPPSLRTGGRVLMAGMKVVRAAQ